MTFLGCFDEGQYIALCSSGYPCYRNIMKATGLHSVNIPVNNEYKITVKELKYEIERRKLNNETELSGLILSSPGNPTGAMLTPIELQELCVLCAENNILFLSDEIYHGISFGINGEKKPEASAVQYSDSCVVINSFSKYFSMTGWRLGEEDTDVNRSCILMFSCSYFFAFLCFLCFLCFLLFCVFLCFLLFCVLVFLCLNCFVSTS